MPDNPNPMIDPNPMPPSVHEADAYSRDQARRRRLRAARSADLHAVFSWFAQPNRRPPTTAFTAGPERDLATFLALWASDTFITQSSAGTIAAKYAPPGEEQE